MATHNRRATTVRAVESLRTAADEVADLELGLVHVDDGSTDGTAAAVLSVFPSAKQIHGDGSWFWAGAMRRGLEVAYAEDPDYVLWLNDDVDLTRSALIAMLNVSPSPEESVIAVGALADPDTGECTYSVVTSAPSWKGTQFRRVPPGPTTETATTMNGNIVLVPRFVYQRVGGFHPIYRHAMADYDYGLRATRAGSSISVTREFVGTCSRNSDSGTFRDPAVSRAIRWKRILSPKGLPVREWLHFQRTHGGMTWPIAFASPYLKVLVGRVPRSPGHEVTVVYRWLPHYRVRLYELLREQLADHGVRLRLIVDAPDPVTALKNDGGSLDWAEHATNRRWRIGKKELVWQPVLRRVRTSDLVVVEQATKLLVNPVFMAWRRCGGPRLAQWGHGVNRDSANASRAGEWIKRLLLKQSDWWFAYSESVAAHVEAAGVPPDIVTNLQNATDTGALQAAARRMRATGTVSHGHHLAFVGSLYEGKGLSDLVTTADRVRTVVPDLQLTVVGDGPDREVLDNAATSRPWLHLVGSLKGDDLVDAVVQSAAIVVPAAAGLVVLDAFAMGVPPVVAAADNHGPEVDYVVDGVNGLRLGVPASSPEFADALVQLLTDADLRERLVEGGESAAAEVTVEEMANRFAHGILGALGLTPLS